MLEYVEGLLFSPDLKEVVLIQKNRPKYLVGLWNGVGGKVERGENPYDATVREFFEEAGLYVGGWELFLELENPGHWVIHFGKAVGDVTKVKTMTDEPVSVFPTSHLPKNVVRNLPWIVPMAMDPELEAPRIITRMMG